MSEWVNFYDHIDPRVANPIEYHNPNAHKHGWAHPMNVVICGSTGMGSQVKSGGKTNSLLNIIHAMNCWDHIFVLTRNPDEPLYRFLKAKGGDRVTVTNEVDELPSLAEVDPSSQNLFVFDDMVTQPKAIQAKIYEYFIRGRKENCSSVYITQSHTMVPKIIRQNCTHIVLKNCNNPKELGRVLRDYNMDFPVDTLRAIAEVGQRDGSFLAIFTSECDPRKKFGDGVYRRFVIPDHLAVE